MRARKKFASREFPGNSHVPVLHRQHHRCHALQLPVLNLQTGHAPEFVGVVGDEGQVVGEGNGGNQKIVGTDDCSQLRQMCPNPAVVVGGLIVEWKRIKLAAKGLRLPAKREQVVNCGEPRKSTPPRRRNREPRFPEPQN